MVEDVEKEEEDNNVDLMEGLSPCIYTMPGTVYADSPQRRKKMLAIGQQPAPHAAHPAHAASHSPDNHMIKNLMPVQCPFVHNR